MRTLGALCVALGRALACDFLGLKILNLFLLHALPGTSSSPCPGRGPAPSGSRFPPVVGCKGGIFVPAHSNSSLSESTSLRVDIGRRIVNLRRWTFGVFCGLGSSICPCLGLGGGLWCSVSDGLGLPSVFEGLGLLSSVSDGLGLLSSVFEGLGLPFSVFGGLLVVPSCDFEGLGLVECSLSELSLDSMRRW